jgi:hypothetical protein
MEEYAAFMHHTPWYAFPFAEARARMPDGGGLRGLERRFAIGAELTAKSWWGWAMGGTSQAAYGVETDRIRAWIRSRGADLATIPGITLEQSLGEGEVLVAMQRYEPFTAAVQAVVAAGGELVEVAGGHTIVVQLRVPAAWSEASLWGDVVFSWPVLTDPAHRRVVVEVPVRRLHEVLPALAGEPVTIEHIYDY